MSTTNADLAEAIGRLEGKVDELARIVGKESDDGKGGSGLIGDVRRATQELKSLTSLRDRGLGAVAAIVIVLSILGVSFRQAIGNVLGIRG